MNSPDKRRHERVVQDRPLRNGELCLIAGNERVAATGIFDFSVSGLSVYLNRPLERGSRVTIEYTGADINIDVYGQIAWCSGAAEMPARNAALGKYIAGIEILGSSILSSVLQKQAH